MIPSHLSPSAAAAPRFVPFTLCEPNYGAGAAALFNSLVAAGFDGVFVIGLKGQPEGWMRKVPARLPTGAQICVVEVPTERHLAHAKALFAQRILDELDPACDGVVYFDPDIVVKAGWSEIVARANSACAVCADENAPPWIDRAAEWIAFARECTGKALALEGPCCNSGFFGVSRAHRRVLELWETLILGCMRQGFSGSSFTWNGERSLPFFFVDQDMLNIAILLAGVPLWIGGPETMDFRPGGHWISHAISTPKPWDRWYLPRVLAGRIVRRCDIAFWQYASAPIPAVNQPLRWLHQADLALARLLSRHSSA